MDPEHSELELSLKSNQFIQSRCILKTHFILEILYFFNMGQRMDDDTTWKQSSVYKDSEYFTSFLQFGICNKKCLVHWKDEEMLAVQAFVAHLLLNMSNFSQFLDILPKHKQTAAWWACQKRICKHTRYNAYAAWLYNTCSECSWKRSVKAINTVIFFSLGLSIRCTHSYSKSWMRLLTGTHNVLENCLHLSSESQRSENNSASETLLHKPAASVVQSEKYAA